ncbi:glycerophosphoryl diester phosphodiesterase family protein [Verticillium alfalfae VaMs.102]|uniref:Glycerophosphoryl diester phosphodiesterase family protein n=1 Tax=Verticillium alfalfae (strain VaMs.102 / ATCC MYA-4576 / FGSC 10136) TaxID=526221 RepID=C9S6W0_VERA1|nr:glycerophosphoryl diester phosphodiesterase family protein [Verticillium alfalfae VaMs.102]EEY14571.1 glycerophosphoryl diester phosphodiesterase family protein [Verticillium alfalfae VaMs.102]
MALTETAPLLGSNQPHIPPAPWSKALPSARDPARRLPQAIAHRGYKSRYPENSMAAFRAAVNVGTHAIETDIHLSADHEGVLSHDGNLKRCFGVDKPVSACPWSYLATLRSLRAPHEPMPRLVDLSDGLAWDQRIVVGCWTQDFLHASLRHLPSYSPAHISHSPYNSNRFLDCPEYAGLSFNMLQPTLVGPYGKRFIQRVRAAPDAEERRLYVWTVNQVEWMEWSIEKGMDGVVTDDPAAYLNVLKRWEEAAAEGSETGSNAAEQQTSTGTESHPPVAAKTTATGLRRWTWLYFQVAAIQVLLMLLTPWLVRRSRWKFTKPSKKSVPKA